MNGRGGHLRSVITRSSPLPSATASPAVLREAAALAVHFDITAREAMKFMMADAALRAKQARLRREQR